MMVVLVRTRAFSQSSGPLARSLMRTFRAPSTSTLMLQASTRPTTMAATGAFLSAV